MEVWVGVLVAVVEVVVIVGVGFWLAQRRRRGRTLSERSRGGVSARRSRSYSRTDLSDEHARS
jgi:putative exporter of polyketide antibiotics